MAIKITTPLGTNQGITNEAYVRISSYEINKYGSATFRLELFQNEAAAKFDQVSPGMYHQGQQAMNQQIGSYLSIPLQKQVTLNQLKTVLEEKPIYVDDLDKPIPDTDPVAYEQKLVRTEHVQVERMVPVQLDEPDISQVIAEGFTVFGYRKLREKLEALFPAASLIDC
jgi:hypothetical protein